MGAEMGVEMDLVTGVGLGGRGRERDWVCWGWRGGGGGERHLQTGQLPKVVQAKMMGPSTR